MIEYQQGSLLNADAQALVNTVNCVGIMGKGIALQFKQKYPDNFRHYERACSAGEMQLGRVLVVSTGYLTNPLFIINFPTKFHWRTPSRLADVEKGLESLVAEIQKRGISSIAVPPLGCGNGGLAWNDVRPRIEAAFARLPEVQVLLFEPGGAPAPAAMPVATKPPGLTRPRALLLRLMELYREPGARLTLLEIQKLAYFLQVAGEPLNLKYARQQYGPYADNLKFVLQRLEGQYIRGYGDNTGQTDIHLLDTAAEALALLAADPPAQERLERVRQLIHGQEQPRTMELLATILWIAQNEDPRANYDTQAAIAGVRDWKQDKFSDRQIVRAWQHLYEQHWLQPVAPVLPSDGDPTEMHTAHPTQE